jgi:hypothetical protein
MPGPLPVAPCAKVESTGVEATGTPGSPGIPCAMVLTAYVALPGDRAFLSPSSADMSCPSPVGPTKTPLT